RVSSTSRGLTITRGREIDFHACTGAQALAMAAWRGSREAGPAKAHIRLHFALWIRESCKLGSSAVEAAPRTATAMATQVRCVTLSPRAVQASRAAAMGAIACMKRTFATFAWFKAT